MPLTVNVNVGLPATTELGMMLVMTGAGLLILIVTELDRPPPGAGLKTVILAVPGLAKSDAGICAVNCVALTNIVGRLAPFQRTTELATKFVPVRVKVTPGAPTNTGLGVMLVNVGTGLGA